MTCHLPDAELMFFDRLLAFDHLRHQIHIVAAADVSRESPGEPTTGASERYRRAGAEIGGGPESGIVAQAGKSEAGKAEGSRRDQPPSISCAWLTAASNTSRRETFFKSSFAAAGFCSGGRCLRSVPRAAPGESVTVSLFPAERRHAHTRIVAGNAGASERSKAGVSADCRDASARTG